MNDQDAKDPNHRAGVYAKRKPGEMTQALKLAFKPIALADVVSGQFDEEEEGDEDEKGNTKETNTSPRQSTNPRGRTRGNWLLTF
jgi:hypothetical protein